ncbi:MAG: hypothetical protein JSU60_03765 [Nitrospirota bacterium]|nr:MAG: hypothetical protein JSU60_03765 [Nitrospirota bacterium]
MRCLHGVMFLLSVVWLAGCMNQTPEPTSHQSALGMGIVEGTKGYQQLQEGLMTRNDAVRKVRGQVHHIEGAAYVVYTETDREVRLPVDENTRIDRPAHKGDWIDAYVNEDGRAVVIRNVDDQVVLD